MICLVTLLPVELTGHDDRTRVEPVALYHTHRAEAPEPPEAPRAARSVNTTLNSEESLGKETTVGQLRHVRGWGWGEGGGSEKLGCCRSPDLRWPGGQDSEIEAGRALLQTYKGHRMRGPDT